MPIPKQFISQGLVCTLNDDGTITTKDIRAYENDTVTFYPGDPRLDKFSLYPRIDAHIIPSDHQYYSKHVMQSLIEVLELTHVGPHRGHSQVMPVENCEIFYDQLSDFHILSFRCNGRQVEVQAYVKLSMKINGKQEWCGCPLHYVYDFAGSIRKHCGLVIPQPVD